MVDLPSALLNFSKTAVRNIDSLSAIQSTISNPQTAVSSNISNAAAGSITANPMFSNVPGFASDVSSNFVSRLTGPPTFSPLVQQGTFSKLFGSYLTQGTAVDGFLNANVRLDDIIPAQQLYNTLNNLGVSSLYSDPLQAYNQVNTASRDLCNLAQEAIGVISDVEADITKLLSVQLGVNYASVQQMDFAFFGQAKGRAAGVQATLTAVVDTFHKRGRFDPAEVGAFCAAANGLVEFVSFADTKLLELDGLRRSLTTALQRLVAIGESIATILQDIVAYVPQYISAVTFGKIFNAVQGKVLDLAGVDIQGILNTLEALSATSTDDMTKLGAIFDMMGTLECLRAFICYLSPGTEVENPSGPFGPLKAGYDGFTAGLSANDPTALFKQLEAHVGVVVPMMNTAMTRDNSAELSSEYLLIGAILTPLALFLANCCNVANVFSGLFKQQTAGMGDRLQGVDVLYTDAGLNAGRDKALTKNFDEVAVIPVSQATTPGELAAALAERIKQLSDGPTKDRLQEAYDRLYARHRATVMSLDFQRRQETALAKSLTRAEEEEEIIRNEINQYGG